MSIDAHEHTLPSILNQDNLTSQDATEGGLKTDGVQRSDKGERELISESSSNIHEDIENH